MSLPQNSDFPPDISVIIPCLNEEENVEGIIAAVKAQLATEGVNYEIIVIDNGSSDRTTELVTAICSTEPRVRLIMNTRNFGQLRSPVHAVYQTRGRAVIGIGADFQDPPALIGEFIARWRRGAKIVLAVRQTEETSWALKTLRAVGYAFFRRFGDYPVIPNATGFGLYDREVVDALSRLNEPEPFFRGMAVETGYRLETVGYDRPPRAAGKSKNNFAILVGFATSGLAGSSKGLLRAPIYLALVFAATSLLFFLIWVIALFMAWASNTWILLAFMQINMSIIMFFIGIVGEQVRIISERTRQTPLVIEKGRINFDD